MKFRSARTRGCLVRALCLRLTKRSIGVPVDRFVGHVCERLEGPLSAPSSNGPCVEAGWTAAVALKCLSRIDAAAKTSWA